MKTENISTEISERTGDYPCALSVFGKDVLR